MPVVKERVDDARIDRLAEWLAAVEGHRSGALDDARSLVLRWTAEDLRNLRTDADSLVSLIADPSLREFRRIEPAPSLRTEIAYTREQDARLVLLACAGRGATRCDMSLGSRPIEPRDPRFKPIPTELEPLAAHVAAAGAKGDFNYLVWRAALLHTDVATLGGGSSPDSAAEPSQPALALRVEDGRIAGVASFYQQWQVAAAMLDHVVPTRGGRPDAGNDPMVRDWYVASIAWTEARGQYDVDHVNHALDLFPSDPDLLFLGGCQHEVYASPEIQEPIKEIKTPPGFTLVVEPGKKELARAEGLFRRALAARPGMRIASVRLGHVLLRLGRYDTAVEELQRALAGLDDPALRYDAELFLGAAQVGLGRFDLAQDAYARALALFPSAQSLHVALSELAFRRGQINAAQAALNRLFALPDDHDRTDPWWTYYRTGVPDPDSLLNRFRERFSRQAPE
jgi:hypothetical protein